MFTIKPLKPIDWPRLSKIIKPCRGKRIAVVHEPMADFMQLIDLDQLFVVMSDSKPDKKSCEKYVRAARGDVLILGFGLGLIVIPIMKKPEVKSVTIVEIQPEVVKLVASQIPLNKKVKIVMGDALLYKPDRKYDCIFYDVDPPQKRLTELEMQGISTEPESHYRPFLKPGGEVLVWNGDYKLYRN
jgi:spermidine synthase